MLVMPAPEFLTDSSKLAEKYRDNLPSPSIASEQECWKVRWQKHGEEHGSVLVRCTALFQRKLM